MTFAPKLVVLRVSFAAKLLVAIIFCTLLARLANPLFAHAQEAGESEKKNADADAAATAVGATMVSFTNKDLKLYGWLYRPEGAGPHPAIIYNHGSEKTPGWFPDLAKFYLGKGYVFFVPHRHGHGRSPGDYIVDLQTKFREQEKDPAKVQKHIVELHERYNSDVVAAVNWLRTQPFVNTNRMIMSGISYGGIQTVLSAEKELGLKAYVPFAPAAMSWAGNPPLRERLLLALRNAKMPVFLLQAENDYNLGPSELLGKYLNEKGGANRAKLYPAYGTTNQEGHGAFATRGSSIWGADVSAFLNTVLKAE